jgi:putative phosphoesterase
MILGVFADSHGNLEYLENAASYAVHKGPADVLIHLGDNYNDAKILNQFGRRVIQVPGVFAQQYQDPSVANRVIETFGQWDVLISHTQEKHLNDLPADIDPAEMIKSRSIRILLYGHTHDARLEEKQGVWFINPGHLKRSDKKDRPATFALIDLNDSNATIRIVAVMNHVELVRKDLTF